MLKYKIMKYFSQLREFFICFGGPTYNSDISNVLKASNPKVVRYYS